MPELLAPAGSSEALRAAFYAGADAVYIGGDRFGARAYADNPGDAELLEDIRLTHRLGKKLYLTVNTLVRGDELEDLENWIRPFYEEGLDAVIVQDTGIVRMLSERYPDLPVHGSTQMTVTGAYGASLLQKHGIRRVVPARELSLEELRQIRDMTGIELEVFIHGAMCCSYSGACLMSSMIGGRSGNRGRCAGICRLPFSVEHDRFRAGDHGNLYPMNMKDLCAADLLPGLISAGISSFKIEGRMKKPEYTAGVTAVYRRALDHILSGKPGAVLSREDKHQLAALYSRDGFTDGYFNQRNGPQMLALENEKLLGVRQKEAQIVTDRIRSELAQKTFDETLKRRVRGTMVLRAGEPADLTVQTAEKKGSEKEILSVTVRRNGVEKADRMPVSGERVRKQLEKTGESDFLFSSLDIRMEDGLFIPMKLLTGLRRDAFAGLESKIRQQYIRLLPQADQHYAEEERIGGYRIPELRALPHSADQLDKLLVFPELRGIYLPHDLYDAAERVRQHGKDVFLAMPYILRQNAGELVRKAETALKEGSWQGILIRSLDEAGWYLKYRKEHGENVPPAILDATVYTMNIQAVRFFRDLGFFFRTLPFELNFRELRQQDTAGTELILYGRTPVMQTAQCLKKTCGFCDGHPDWVRLTDRKKMAFPVFTDCGNCSNIVYNSLPTGLIRERQAVLHLNCGSGRLSFTDETPEEVRKITAAYIDVFVKDEPPPEAGSLPQTTKGHFRRGVE